MALGNIDNRGDQGAGRECGEHHNVLIHERKRSSAEYQITKDRGENPQGFTSWHERDRLEKRQRTDNVKGDREGLRRKEGLVQKAELMCENKENIGKFDRRKKERNQRIGGEK